MTPRGPNFGWLTTLREIAAEDPTDIRHSLEGFVRDAGPGQRSAWNNSIPIVRDASVRATTAFPSAGAHSIFFEYELPREGGRRPDVVVLENGTVVVVEFKGKESATRGDLDQVAAYARDIRNYHSESHGRFVLPVLVPERYAGARRKYDDVEVVSPGELDKLLVEVSRDSAGGAIDAEVWACGDYAPLPALIQAARDIFDKRPLPFIRRAQSAGIPEALEYLVTTAHLAAKSKSRHLVLLTGVPGAGKTLVGLQFVHHGGLDDLAVRAADRPRGASAVFLSGNGPLVRVLQHALRGPSGEEKIFVEGIKQYLKHYALRKRPRVPPEHILVFDEAQRAWDAEQIREKHEVEGSEPDLVIGLATTIPEWAMVLGLIGEGQEIHKGEEGGIQQWAAAVSASANPGEWTVHGPPRLRSHFVDRGLRYELQRALDLTVTLRSHLSSELYAWVAGVLQADDLAAPKLAAIAATIRQQGFSMYITRDKTGAAKYVRERYAGMPNRRFGWLASSRAHNLEALAIDNSFQTTKRLKEGPWYNDPPDSPFSCCALQTVATEFASQGLELDLPIVCWGDDLYREAGVWKVAERRLRGSYRNPDQLRINSYRVLLTRGRDGLVVFVPPDQADGMDATAEFLEKCGLVQLSEPR
jgi:Uncharacterized conserved protein (DUF2075)